LDEGIGGSCDDSPEIVSNDLAMAWRMFSWCNLRRHDGQKRQLQSLRVEARSLLLSAAAPLASAFALGSGLALPADPGRLVVAAFLGTPPPTTAKGGSKVTLDP